LWYRRQRWHRLGNIEHGSQTGFVVRAIRCGSTRLSVAEPTSHNYTARVPTIRHFSSSARSCCRHFGI
jgi:hypothetical protein